MKRKDLVIVESKRKAERLAAILGDAYVVMACPEPLRTLLHVDREALVEYYRGPEHLDFTIRGLEQAVVRAGRIMLATDPDRTGEASAWHIAAALPDRVQDKIFRARLPALTTEAVLAAVESSEQRIDMNSVNAWRTRQMINWLIVDALTPLLQRWKLLEERDFDLDRTALAALQLLVKREWDCNTQSADQPWHVRVQLTANGRQFWADLEDGTLFRNEQEVYALIDLLLQAETGWQVEKVTHRDLTEKPRPPFTFSTLLQDAAAQLWLSPGVVQSAVQELYEAGLITYYCTSSTTVDSETTSAHLSVLDAAFGERLAPVLATAGQLKADEHGAIRPIDLGQDLLEIEGLSEAAHTIYNRIWLRYVSSLLRPAKFRFQEIIIRPTWTGSAEPWEDERTYPHPFTFRAELRELVEPGWRAVYPWPHDQQEEQAESGLMLELNECAMLTAAQIAATKLQDNLDRYTVTSLLAALDQCGISRPHTMVAALEQLIAHGYARLAEDRLIPTPKGEDVICLCTTHFAEVFDLSFNTRLENMLDQVANGELDRKQVLAAFDRRFKPAVDEAYRTIFETVEGDLPTFTIQRESA